MTADCADFTEGTRQKRSDIVYYPFGVERQRSRRAGRRFLNQGPSRWNSSQRAPGLKWLEGGVEKGGRLGNWLSGGPSSRGQTPGMAGCRFRAELAGPQAIIFALIFIPLGEKGLLPGSIRAAAHLPPAYKPPVPEWPGGEPSPLGCWRKLVLFRSAVRPRWQRSWRRVRASRPAPTAARPVHRALSVC